MNWLCIDQDYPLPVTSLFPFVVELPILFLSELELHKFIEPLILILILILKLGDLIACLDFLHDSLLGDAGVLAVHFLLLVFELHTRQLVDIFVALQCTLLLLHS